MELGGAADPEKFNISFNEYDLITAANLVLETQTALTLKGSFETFTSTSPLTINASQFDVTESSEQHLNGIDGSSRGFASTIQA